MVRHHDAPGAAGGAGEGRGKGEGSRGEERRWKYDPWRRLGLAGAGLGLQGGTTHQHRVCIEG